MAAAGEVPQVPTLLEVNTAPSFDGEHPEVPEITSKESEGLPFNTLFSCSNPEIC